MSSETPPPDAQQQQQPQYQVVPGNGVATASLVLAIVGVVFGIVPLTGFIAFICGALAVLFGFMGLRKHGRETPKGKGSSITGLVLGGLALVLGIWGMTVVFGAVDEMGEVFDEFEREMDEIGDDLEDL
jgi:hypothetical protein